MRKMTQDEYRSAVIAQEDSGGYDPGGYVAIVIDGVAAMGRFGHCSCYGTFEALCGGGISDYFEEGTPTFDWEGTPQELVAMAQRIADPAMPSRAANSEDYDYGYLTRLYEKIIAWSNQPCS